MQKIYRVGGAVRDHLSGREPKDMDYVVVGSSAQQMLAAGYLQVGADFPVFLHPQTRDEYALARVERKTAAGYLGFTVDTTDVTLEEDLSRRDLTINAMAMDELGGIIDPFGGRADLKANVLRHVSHAFSEDPLRILRLARFKARFGPTWSVAPETQKLLQSMVGRGALDELTRERVWVEFEKGFNEPFPHLMLKLLQGLGVFGRASFSEYAAFQEFNSEELELAVQKRVSLAAKVALVLPRNWTSEQAKASRIPSFVREAAQGYFATLAHPIQSFPSWSLEDKLSLLERLDVLRRPTRFEAVCEAICVQHPTAAAAMQEAWQQVQSVNQAAAIGKLKEPLAIKAAIKAARLRALAPAVSA